MAISQVRDLFGEASTITWCCPQHGAELDYRDGAWLCPEGHSFAVREGIPRFIVQKDNYAAAFGRQWNHFRNTQLDSHTGATITRDRIRRCLGEELWHSLPGKQVLECGCGAGRFTEILLAKGALVTSIDLSDAVEANAITFPPGRSHRVAQADILHLPFALQQFDVVFCLGVIQHTPSPEKTIAALYAHVRPGGTLVIDHYKRTLGAYTRFGTWICRAYFTRLPPGAAISKTEALVRALLPLHKWASRSRFSLPLLTRVSPVASYYHLLPELSDEQQLQWALLDTHDGLTDYYKHLRTEREIVRRLQALGLTNIWANQGGNGVEARGSRPLE